MTRISCAQIYPFRHIHPQAIYIIIGKNDQEEIIGEKKKETANTNLARNKTCVVLYLMMMEAYKMR